MANELALTTVLWLIFQKALKKKMIPMRAGVRVSSSSTALHQAFKFHVLFLFFLFAFFSSLTFLLLESRIFLLFAFFLIELAPNSPHPSSAIALH